MRLRDLGLRVLAGSATARRAAGLAAVELDRGSGLRWLYVLEADDISQGGVARGLQLLQLVLGQAARRDAVDLRKSNTENGVKGGTCCQLGN